MQATHAGSSADMDRCDDIMTSKLSSLKRFSGQAFCIQSSNLIPLSIFLLWQDLDD